MQALTGMSGSNGDHAAVQISSLVLHPKVKLSLHENRAVVHRGSATDGQMEHTYAKRINKNVNLCACPSLSTSDLG